MLRRTQKVRTSLDAMRSRQILLRSDWERVCYRRYLKVFHLHFFPDTDGSSSFAVAACLPEIHAGTRMEGNSFFSNLQASQCHYTIISLFSPTQFCTNEDFIFVFRFIFFQKNVVSYVAESVIAINSASFLLICMWFSKTSFII